MADSETLDHLLSLSLTPSGRADLTSTIPTLLSLLPTSPSLLLPRLRLLRNLCAGDPTNQSSFISSHGPAAILSLIPHSPPKTIHVALQLLGNAALGGEAHRAAVWEIFFPDGFLSLARVRDPAVCGTLSMILDTCCSEDGGRRRLGQLCQEKGLTIVFETISTASTVGYQQEWLEWLLAKICIEEQYLFLLFHRLSPEVVSTGFSKEQAFLLRALSKCLTERPGEILVQNGFALCVLDYLKKASGIVDFYTRGSSALPTGTPDIDVLGYCLTILRDVCAWEGPSGGEDYVVWLLRAGLMDIMLSFLREIEPPSVVRKAMQARETAEGPSKVCPYHGFRKDVVSVICNSVRRRKQAQDEIRERDGILIILQQCVLDEENPFLREWGLLTVHYLLDGNEDNQRVVAELQLLEPINTAEIDELGLRVELDRERHRAKLVNNS